MILREPADRWLGAIETGEIPLNAEDYLPLHVVGKQDGEEHFSMLGFAAFMYAEELEMPVHKMDFMGDKYKFAYDGMTTMPPTKLIDHMGLEGMVGGIKIHLVHEDVKRFLLDRIGVVSGDWQRLSRLAAVASQRHGFPFGKFAGLLRKHPEGFFTK